MSQSESNEARELAEDHRAEPVNSRGLQRLLICLFGVLSLLLAVVGHWYYRQQVESVRNDKFDDLRAIADLKVNQLVQWRNERVGDAQMYSTESFLRAAVGGWRQASGDASSRAGIQERMESLRNSYGYEDAILAGTDGAILLSFNPLLSALEADAKQLAARAISSRGVVFGDFCRCSTCNRVQIDVAAPILDANGRPAAVLILRTDPERYLYPLIRSWPLPSRTAETVLVRRDGEDVLFLNELRHQSDPALTLRVPLSKTGVPAVKAALGEIGDFEGRDYRGVDVLADVRPVPDSPWFLVAKVDTSEILAEAGYRGRVVLVFVAMSVAMTGGMVAFVFIFRQRSLYQSLYYAEHQRQEAREGLRASEERFRSVIETSPDAIALLDFDTRFLMANQQEATLVGFESAQQLIASGLTGLDLLAQEERDRAKQDIGRLVELGVLTGSEYTALRRDGTRFPCEINASLQRDSLGDPTAMLLIVRDISERRRAQEALHGAKEAAEAASRAKSEFLANMSHEIRTPMTAILGFADLLDTPSLSRQEQAEFLDGIRRNGKALVELINDILDLSRIEADKVVLEKSAYPLRQLVDDALSSVKLRADQKGLNLDVDSALPLPETVHTDPVHLRQILVNLLANAVKFTEQGGVRMTVRCIVESDDSARMQFAVSDTGIGIPPEKAGKLFRPFVQGDASLTRRYGGTGLGLAISKRLAQALGGDIELQSEAGKGSTFTLTIDAGSLKDAVMLQRPTAPAAANERPRPKEPGALLSGRVLLAEDVGVLHRVFSEILQSLGLEVEVASDGRAACDMAEKSRAEGKPYDLILMDMQMPQVDGYKAAQRLRRQGWQGPIVALTAHAMAGDREKCLEAGCDDYLAKPITMSALREILARYLGFAAPATDPAEGAQPSSAKPMGSLDGGPLDAARVARLVAAFAEELPARAGAIQSACRDRSLPRVSELAHQLKGTAGIYGLAAVAETAHALQQRAAEQQDWDQLQTAVNELVQLCAAAAGQVPSPSGRRLG